MQDIVEVGLDPRAPFEDFVLVAGDLETLFGFLEAHKGNICQFDLVGWLVDPHFDGFSRDF